MATVTDTSYTWGTGRRKTAVARVRIREGNGQFVVNDRPVDEYFEVESVRQRARLPLTTTDMGGRLDVFVNVGGGGKSAQAGAVLMGLARALMVFRTDLEASLRGNGFLTRDARKVERKMYGHKK